MKEKKKSLLIILIILLSIAIIVMGCYIYELYNKNMLSINEIDDLNNKISNLENAIKVQEDLETFTNNELEEATDNEVSTNTADVTNDSSKNDKITSLNGTYMLYLDEPNDVANYIFYSDGKVELAGNYTKTGTYEIKDNMVKIKFNKSEGPEMEVETINENDELLLWDADTLFRKATQSIYEKYSKVK